MSIKASLRNKSVDEKLNIILEKLLILDTVAEDVKTIRDQITQVETRTTNVEARVKRLEEICGNEFPAELCIMMSNIPVSQNEVLLDQVNKMIESGLGLVITAKAAIRMPSRNYQGTRPPLVKCEFDSLEQKLEVLKNKKKLKESDEYEGVYLKSAQTHTERLLELNMKEIIKTHPDKDKFRFTGSGRLIRKE